MFSNVRWTPVLTVLVLGVGLAPTTRSGPPLPVKSTARKAAGKTPQKAPPATAAPADVNYRRFKYTLPDVGRRVFRTAKELREAYKNDDRTLYTPAQLEEAIASVDWSREVLAAYTYRPAAPEDVTCGLRFVTRVGNKVTVEFENLPATPNAVLYPCDYYNQGAVIPDRTAEIVFKEFPAPEVTTELVARRWTGTIRPYPPGIVAQGGSVWQFRVMTTDGKLGSRWDGPGTGSGGEVDAAAYQKVKDLISTSRFATLDAVYGDPNPRLWTRPRQIKCFVDGQAVSVTVADDSVSPPVFDAVWKAIRGLVPAIYSVPSDW